MDTSHHEHSGDLDTDLYLQFQLGQLISIIDKNAAKDKIKDLKLVYASFTSTTLLSPDFFKTHVCD